MISRKLHSLVPALLFCAFFQCSNPNLIAPNPPSSNSSGESLKKKNEAKKRETGPQEIDFGDVFDSSFDSSLNASIQAVETPFQNVSYRYPSFRVERNMVRIALVRNTPSVTFYSIGTVDIRQPGGVILEPFRGRVFAECMGGTNSAVLTASWGTAQVTLPCTLLSRNDYNFIEVDEGSYRGSMILSSEKKGVISVINYIDVEEYLRGVVPLEIGRRPQEEIDAMKAQAIAARTYTYRRIQERSNHPFDMTCTVSDQVYGGANAEYRISDLAIRLTRDMVLVYRDSLAVTFYHSTCGGRTTNVEDAWDRPECGYLRSVSDLDSSGESYCKTSPAFSWREEWSTSQFSTIVLKSLNELYPKKEFKGRITDFRVDDVYSCGRVKSCTIKGAKWDLGSGKDQIRFILRRTAVQNPILRSSRFKVISSDKRGFVVEGFGYGHGVGMCQMGAVGRARQKQSFETILKAYYTGAIVYTAVPKVNN